MNKKEERIFFTLSNVLDRKDTKTAEDILASCPSILSTKWKGMTLLYVACMRNRAYAASFLLDHGADANVRDRRGDTPLHIACYYGNHGVARLLLEHGAEVDASDTDGWTPLHNACFDGHAATVRLLLDHGADPDARNDEGEAPLDVMLRSVIDQEQNQAILELFQERFPEQYFSAWCQAPARGGGI